MPRAKRPPKPAPRPAAIERAREDAMEEIARRRRDGGDGNALLDKAQLLLTRHWARSGWAARAKLIESAGWLIGVSGSTKARAAR